MKIGTIDLGPRPLLLAPMEDVTDVGFRLLCRRMGAAMVYSEFVAADALVRMVKPSLAKLHVVEEERPVAIQIYGKDPVAMADAAQIVVEQARPDVLDINFGCPVKRVAAKGAGAGLLQNVPLLLQIARSVVEAVDIPVTAKTRLGWDCEHLIIPRLARDLQETGIQALTIHGRTRSQMYTGRADWSLIGQVKADPAMRIPIIGNGDITTPAAAREAFERYGVDAVMVGRATFGRPWVFAEMREALGQPPVPASAAAPIGDPDRQLDILKQQVLESVARTGEKRGILHIRRHLAATPLFKGIPDFRQHRIAILRAETVADLFRLLEEARPLVHAQAATATQNESEMGSPL
ncbi:MAG: tRNA-dihydrouridine synthase family protein [Bacteroidaceae bacterium]|nr:tRNA-dihydrouridine synthase family protein [Bacteroidaceae bacterium]